MGGFFKKAMKIVHPAMRLFEDRGNPQGYTDLGTQQGHQADLDSAMKDYGNIETNVRSSYTDAAKKAGTYANTNEFNSGLNSEVQSGIRGARVNAVARINAMRKAMGNNEEFKPEGFDQTQGNQTADKLAESPVKEDSAPAPAAPEDAPAAKDATQMNATASLQNAPARRPLGLGGNAASRLGALQRKG